MNDKTSGVLTLTYAWQPEDFPAVQAARAHWTSSYTPGAAPRRDAALGWFVTVGPAVFTVMGLWLYENLLPTSRPVSLGAGQVSVPVYSDYMLVFALSLIATGGVWLMWRRLVRSADTIYRAIFDDLSCETATVIFAPGTIRTASKTREVVDYAVDAPVVQTSRDHVTVIYRLGWVVIPLRSMDRDGATLVQDIERALAT